MARPMGIEILENRDPGRATRCRFFENFARLGKMQAHRYLHRGAPEARAILETQTMMFPDGLQIVRASYRESAGRLEVRSSTPSGGRSSPASRRKEPPCSIA